MLYELMIQWHEVYMVYIWRFPCLDYSFDVLISRIYNLSLYNWFYHIYFTCYLLTCSCMPMFTTRFSMHDLVLRFIDTRVLIPACHLAFTIPLVGEFWLPWTCMFRSQSMELVDSSCCWSEMRRGSVDHRQTIWSPILPAPLLVSWVFLL